VFKQHTFERRMKMNQTVNFKFALGEVVREKITGFEGVIMSQCNYISGCVQYGVLSRKLTTEGKTHDWTYYDENRLALIGEEKIVLDEGQEIADTPTGGEDFRMIHDSSSPRSA
jgi:hypothetical protein